MPIRLNLSAGGGQKRLQNLPVHLGIPPPADLEDTVLPGEQIQGYILPGAEESREPFQGRLPLGGGGLINGDGEGLFDITGPHGSLDAAPDEAPVQSLANLSFEPREGGRK